MVVKTATGGSNPPLSATTFIAPVAQWIEHWSTEPVVGGSNPLGRGFLNRGFERSRRTPQMEARRQGVPTSIEAAGGRPGSPRHEVAGRRAPNPLGREFDEAMKKSGRSVHEYFMREALKEAGRAFDQGEVPVGAVVVYRRNVIGRAHNQTETLRDPTAHAEMIAITQAAEALSAGKKDHRGSLEGAAIYVTKEPCPMCAGAMVLSKTKEIIFGVADPKAGACGSLFNLVEDDRLNHRLLVQGGVLAEDARAFLQEFFRTLRKEKR